MSEQAFYGEFSPNESYTVTHKGEHVMRTRFVIQNEQGTVRCVVVGLNEHGGWWFAIETADNLSTFENDRGNVWEA